MCFFYSNHKLHSSSGILPQSSDCVRVTAQYLSEENSLHKFRAARRYTGTAFVASQRWMLGERERGRATVAARQLITPWQIAEPGVLLGNARAMPCSCWPLASASGSFHLVDYARRIPRDMLRRRKHASRGNGGLRCLLETPVSVKVNGSSRAVSIFGIAGRYVYLRRLSLSFSTCIKNILIYWILKNCIKERSLLCNFIFHDIVNSIGNNADTACDFILKALLLDMYLGCNNIIREYI